jgi:hypothetical protein
MNKNKVFDTVWKSLLVGVGYAATLALTNLVLACGVDGYVKTEMKRLVIPGLA